MMFGPEIHHENVKKPMRIILGRRVEFHEEFGNARKYAENSVRNQPKVFCWKYRLSQKIASIMAARVECAIGHSLGSDALLEYIEDTIGKSSDFNVVSYYISLDLTFQ